MLCPHYTYIFLPAFLGLRLTRSKREFNPHVLQTEVLTLLKVDSGSLLCNGSSISEAAWQSGVEEDFEQLDAGGLARRFSAPSSAVLQPLEGLLTPVDLLPPRKRTRYVPELGLSTAERKKLKDRHRARDKRAQARAEVQKSLHTNLKSVALRKAAETKAAAVVCDFAGPSATAWTGSRAAVPYPKVHSVLDVLALSGLKYVEWDGRFVSFSFSKLYLMLDPLQSITCIQV